MNISKTVLASFILAALTLTGWVGGQLWSIEHRLTAIETQLIWRLK
jgi:hypothetical protein